MNWNLLILSSTLFSMFTLDHLEAARPSGHGGSGGGAHFASARTPSMSRVESHPPAQHAFSAHTAPHFSPQKQSFQQLQTRNQTSVRAAQTARNQIGSKYPGYNNWFSNQFNQNHHYNPNFHHNNANWWSAANWYGINNWVSGDWNTPIYYDYQDEGEPEPIEVDNYLPPEPAYPEYPQEVPIATPTQNDWMPIGVFAAAKDVSQASRSNMFVQLALNKAGDIAGTYYNATTDETHPLDGTIDKKSQVASWRVSDNPASPLMQTGLYNLTQEVTPVQVRFPDDTSQTWYLVKMQQ